MSELEEMRAILEDMKMENIKSQINALQHQMVLQGAELQRIKSMITQMATDLYEEEGGSTWTGLGSN